MRGGLFYFRLTFIKVFFLFDKALSYWLSIAHFLHFDNRSIKEIENFVDGMGAIIAY